MGNYSTTEVGTRAESSSTKAEGYQETKGQTQVKGCDGLTDCPSAEEVSFSGCPSAEKDYLNQAEHHQAEVTDTQVEGLKTPTRGGGRRRGGRTGWRQGLTDEEKEVRQAAEEVVVPSTS